MSETLLQFTKSFEKLKSDLKKTGRPDQKIYRLLGFWKNLENKISKTGYRSFVYEYTSRLILLITSQNLQDMTVGQLKSLCQVLQALTKFDSKVKIAVQTASKTLAEKYFYAGEIEMGLTICQSIVKHNIQDIPQFDDSVVLEIERFRAVCEAVRNQNDKLYKILQEILIDWEAVKESVKQDQANCLFVEKNGDYNSQCGYLKGLCGTVEPFEKSAVADEITFESISVKPDDPFIGVSYEALKAVRKIFKYSGFNDKGKLYYHAHYNIDNNSESFTGDSIGLSVAALTYVQLLKTEVSRQDKLLSSEVAFTGSIDKDGNIISVNDDSLYHKIERVFFSPIKY